MSKQKLLLADDSITIQKVVNLTFADEGIEVISVGDGNSAMEKFVESTPDLVMVDVNMPGLDGYRICEMIKQDEETKHVPVILLVGSFEPFDENEARRVGANDYLTKPFQSIRQLVNKVSVLLSKSNGNDPSVQTPEITPESGVEAQQKPETPVQNVEAITESEFLDQDRIQTPVYPIEADAEPEVDGQTPFSEDEEPFGDAGMDDEMIQANQVGSLPVDEFRRFESAEIETQSHEESTQVSSDDHSYDEGVDSKYDRAKTQPFTADEVREISSNIPEIVDFEGREKIFAEENDAEKERAISLENQMVSEFETESNESVPEFESQVNEISVDEYFGRDKFSTEEVTVENELVSGESPPETGFHIEEFGDQSEPVEKESLIEDEPIDGPNGDWEIYESPENAEVPEPEEPDHYVEYITSDEKSAILPEMDSDENTSAEFTDSATSYQDRKELDPNRGTAFSGFDLDEVPIPPDISEVPKSDGFEPVSEQPVYFEDDISVDTQAERIEPETNNTESESFDKVEGNFEGAETIRDFQGSENQENDHSTVEIPLPIPTIEEEVSPIQEIPPTEFKTGDATAKSPVSAMVSTKDTSDAVESVIVSEFARHSISLSSEAVETIAARIAEKISEKIVQQLATDVVTDLADLIVDRMEQRKLK